MLISSLYGVCTLWVRARVRSYIVGKMENDGFNVSLVKVDYSVVEFWFDSDLKMVVVRLTIIGLP